MVASTRLSYRIIRRKVDATWFAAGWLPMVHFYSDRPANERQWNSKASRSVTHMLRYNHGIRCRRVNISLSSANNRGFLTQPSYLPSTLHFPVDPVAISNFVCSINRWIGSRGKIVSGRWRSGRERDLQPTGAAAK